MRKKDKTAWTLVTGAGKGLGSTICRELARAGCNLVVHYHTSKEAAYRVVKECRSLGVLAEPIQGSFDSIASTQDFIKRYLKQFRNTQSLINNVGNYLLGKASAVSIDDALYLFQTNFF